MPSKKRKDGTFRDIAHPLNSETRGMMEEKILAHYKGEVSGAGDLSPRSLGAEEAGGNEHGAGEAGHETGEV